MTALVPFLVVGIAEDDTIGAGKNIVAGASLNIVKVGGGSASIYADEAGTTPITLPTTLDSSGQKMIFIPAGPYNIIIGGVSRRQDIIGFAGTTLSIDTFDDLATTPATTAGMVVYLKQHTSGGLGGGFFQDTMGSTGTNYGTIINNSVTAGRHWLRINYFKLTPEMFGVVGDGSTNDDTALSRFLAVSTESKIDRDTVSTLTVREAIDGYFYGDGSLSSVYRRQVIPTLSKVDDLVLSDVVPAKHLRQACKTKKPTVMLIGDSISTYNANSISRGDMLVETLRQTLDKQFPEGVNFYDRAIGGANYAALFSDASSPNIPWYTTNTVNWITDTYNTLLPDLVFIAFGMNDNSSLALYQIKDAVDFYKSRAKPPSIILCTNLVPRPKSVNVGAGTEKAIMDARDYSAGLVRTYAKYANVGLLDFHRKLCLAQDGFDPVSSVFKTTAAITPTIFGGTQNLFTSVTPCSDFGWILNFDDSASGTLSGGGIVIEFGGGFIQLTRSGSTLGMAIYIDATLVFGTYYSASFSNAVTNWVVERKNGYLNIYHPSGAPAYGSFDEPTVNVKIPYAGGDITPISVRGVGLLNASFLCGEYIKCKPSAKNIDIWNDESTPTPYGGSGFNHPSNFIASHVYRPLVEGTSFYTHIPVNDFKSASLSSGSPVSLTTNFNTVVVTLALTDGVWDISGTVGFLPAATTNISSLKVGVTTSGTSFSTIDTYQQVVNCGVPNLEVALTTPTWRITVVGSATVGLLVRPVFTVSTLSAYGYVRATMVN